MNKKADGGLTAIVIILIALVFLGWLINMGSRQCSTNADCKADQYCGSDFACHSIPVIEKQPIVINRNYDGVINTIAIAAIIITVILNIDKIGSVFKRKRHLSGEDEEPVYTNFPVYYKKASK